MGSNKAWSRFAYLLLFVNFCCLGASKKTIAPGSGKDGKLMIRWSKLGMQNGNSVIEIHENFDHISGEFMRKVGYPLAFVLLMVLWGRLLGGMPQAAPVGENPAPSPPTPVNISHAQAQPILAALANDLLPAGLKNRSWRKLPLGGRIG